MVRITIHVLCLLVLLANGFIPSVLSTNLMFLGSSANSLYVSLKFCHYPLLGIGWMLKFSIVLALIKSMPVHKFCILRVCEQTPQPINHGEVPHHQSRNPSLRVIVYFIALFGLLLGLLSLLPYLYASSILFLSIVFIHLVPTRITIWTTL